MLLPVGMRSIHVVAALIRQGDRILLDRRGPGGTLAGKWEFPGGKREAGETDEEALARELMEELGVASTIGPEVARVRHETPDLSMTLVLYAASIHGRPEARDVEEIGWFDVAEIDQLEMPPADRPLLEVVKRTTSARRAPPG